MKEGGQALLGGLDCMVQRNYFGAQVSAAEAAAAAAGLSAAVLLRLRLLLVMRALDVDAPQLWMLLPCHWAHSGLPAQPSKRR